MFFRLIFFSFIHILPHEGHILSRVDRSIFQRFAPFYNNFMTSLNIFILESAKIKIVHAPSKIICFLIIIMDVSAGILGIEAEVAQNMGKHSRILVLESKVLVHKAFKLGLAALVLLTVAHLIANLLGGCPRICTREELERATADKQMAAATLVLSWIILVAGFTLLMLGTMLNSQSRIASCGLLRRHFLFIGGVLCFLHGLSIMAYYVSSVAASSEGARQSRRVHA